MSTVEKVLHHELDAHEEINQTNYSPPIDFRESLNAVAVGVTISETGSGRINFANQMFCTMVGYAAKEISDGQLSLIELTAPDDLRENVRLHQELISGKIERFTIEKRYVRKDGSSCWARKTAIRIEPALGGVERMLGVIEDINEQIATRNEAVALCSRAPFHIVTDYISCHWNKPISINDLAKMAGCSSRALFKHFKIAHGYTPLVYIKRLRLERSRAMLQDGPTNRSVTGIAFFCGFSNLGHFARDYNERFGELPSMTLKRARFG